MAALFVINNDTFKIRVLPVDYAKLKDTLSTCVGKSFQSVRTLFKMNLVQIIASFHSSKYNKELSFIINSEESWELFKDNLNDHHLGTTDKLPCTSTDYFLFTLLRAKFMESSS